MKGNKKFYWFSIPYDIFVNNHKYGNGNIDLGFNSFEPTDKDGKWAKTVTIDGIYRDMLGGKILNPNVPKEKIDIRFGVAKFIGYETTNEYRQELLTAPV